MANVTKQLRKKIRPSMREEKAAESHRKVKVKPASDESDWVDGGHSAAVGGSGIWAEPMAC